MRAQRVWKSVGGGVLGRAVSSASACGAMCESGAGTVAKVGAFMARQLRGLGWFRSVCACPKVGE